MVARVNEGLQVVLGTERLHLAGLLVLDDADALVRRDSIVKRSGRGRKLDGAIWEDFWLRPAFCLRPIHTEHVICEDAPELQVILTNGLDLAYINLIDFEVRRLLWRAYRTVHS